MRSNVGEVPNLHIPEDAPRLFGEGVADVSLSTPGYLDKSDTEGTVELPTRGHALNPSAAPYRVPARTGLFDAPELDIQYPGPK